MTATSQDQAPPRPVIVLVDGHSLVYRAYHAIPAGFMTSRGEATNAVFGFTSMLLKVLGDVSPEYCAVTFDLSTPTFRHLASADYKATRPRMADELRQQFGRVRQIVDTLNIPLYEQDGYEADDLLGGLAAQAEAQGLDTIVTTGDLDSLQLVTDHVRVLAPRARISDTILYDVPAVRQRYGLDPLQLPDFKALSGDASDNIKGVPSIGPKTASKLLATYGSIEQLYARLDELAPKLRDLLATHEQLVRGNKKLATIDRSIPCILDLERSRLAEYDRGNALALFQELEFRSLVEKLPRVNSTAIQESARSAGGPVSGSTAESGPRAATHQMSLFGNPNTPPSNGAAAGQTPTTATRAGPGEAGEAGVDGQEGTTSRTMPPAPPATATGALVITEQELQAVLDAVRGAGACLLHPMAVQRSVVDHDLAGLAIATGPLPGPSASPEHPETAARAWYIPFARESATAPEPRLGLSEAAVLAALRPLIEDQAIRKIGHNAKVIITLLAERNVQLRGLAFDTMVAAYLLNPSNRSATIRELIFQQAGREISDIASLAPKGTSLLSLSAEDVAPAATLEAQLLWQIAQDVRHDLEDRAQLALFERVELPLIPVLSAVERAGIKVDEQVLGAMSRELAEQVRQVELEIYNAVGHQFTINSPQQLGRVLVEELHLPLTRRTKTGVSTDAAALEELLGTHPAIEHILTYRQLTKLKSTYIDTLPSLINARTGRIHTTFNQAVAATGRLSSDSPNLQNIPIRTEIGRKIRRAFVAGEPDTVLLAADYAQIELRIAAHLTRDPLLIGAFLEDEDIHAATASTVFNVPLEQVTPDQRRLAKTTNFAVLYGISDFGLSQRVGIARSEAAPFIKAYLDRYEGIRRYIETTIQQAKKRGYVETPLGRRRYLPEIRAQNAAVRAAGERMAINMPIQGAQADLIKLAMIAIHGELGERRLRTRMLLQVHDELVFEAPRAELIEVAQLVRQRMEGAMDLIVPIKVEMKAGENWHDMRPLSDA